MEVSWKDKKTNEEVLALVRERFGKISDD
jgi:hypothetical protein